MKGRTSGDGREDEGGGNGSNYIPTYWLLCPALFFSRPQVRFIE